MKVLGKKPPQTGTAQPAAPSGAGGSKSAGFLKKYPKELMVAAAAGVVIILGLSRKGGSGAGSMAMVPSPSGAGGNMDANALQSSFENGLAGVNARIDSLSTSSPGIPGVPDRPVDVANKLPLPTTKKTPITKNPLPKTSTPGRHKLPTAAPKPRTQPTARSSARAMVPGKKTAPVKPVLRGSKAQAKGVTTPRKTTGRVSGPSSRRGD